MTAMVQAGNDLSEYKSLGEQRDLEGATVQRGWMLASGKQLRGTGSFSPQEALQVVDEIRVAQPEVELKQKLRLLN